MTSRLDKAENRISALKDKIAEITQAEQQKEKSMKNIGNSLRELGDNIKFNNL